VPSSGVSAGAAEMANARRVVKVANTVGKCILKEGGCGSWVSGNLFLFLLLCL